MQQAKAVVVGAVGIDTNVYLAGGGIDWTVESNFVETFDVVGQAGAYAARGFAALGLATTLVGAVGDDEAGEWVRGRAALWGIETTWLTDPARTHRSVNLVFGDGSRKNFYDGGGGAVSVAAVPVSVFSGAAIVHVHIEDWCRDLLASARSSGALVSSDLQDVSDLDDPYRRDFIEAADVLFFSGVDQRDPAAAAGELLARGSAEFVVAGLGAAGALVATPGAVTHLEAVAMDDPVVDTNGAGDSLAVGTLWSLATLGTEPLVAVRHGQVAAGWICRRRANDKQPIDAATLLALAADG